MLFISFSIFWGLNGKNTVFKECFWPLSILILFWEMSKVSASNSISSLFAFPLSGDVRILTFKKSPWWNSNVERVHKTIDDEYYLNSYKVWSNIYQWLHYYNFERIHLLLNGLTPKEKLFQSVTSDCQLYISSGISGI